MLVQPAGYVANIGACYKCQCIVVHVWIHVGYRDIAAGTLVDAVNSNFMDTAGQFHTNYCNLPRTNSSGIDVE